MINIPVIKKVLLDLIIKFIKSELLERLLMRAAEELLKRDDSEINLDKSNKITNEIKLARHEANR